MKKKISLLFLSGLYLLGVLVYWFQIGGSSTIGIRDPLYLLTPFAAFAYGLYAFSQYGHQGTRAKTVLLLTLGMGGWLVGEILFTYFQDIMHTNPFPSLADIFYLLAYPFLFFGLINEISSSHVNWKKVNKAVFFLLLIASLAIGAIVVYFGVILGYDSAQPLFTNIIAISYGIGDLLLILATMIVLVLAWEFRGGSLSTSWLIFFISFVATLVADILYAIYSQQYDDNKWFYKSLIDSFFMLGYVLFAYAMLTLGLAVEDAKEKILQLSKKK